MLRMVDNMNKAVNMVKYLDFGAVGVTCHNHKACFYSC